MSEPLSVCEQIVAAVEAKLKTVSAANGYANTFSEVLRPRRTGELLQPKSLGVYLLQGRQERAKDDDIGGAIAWSLPVAVNVVLRLSEKAATPMDQVLNSLAADVQKALMADRQWGGLAIETDFVAVEYPEGNNGFEGVTVIAEITYRVSETDPTQTA